MAMEITIFAKSKHTKEGKPFTVYLATLRKKTGSLQTVTVRFRETCTAPKAEDCPKNILIEKDRANLAERHYVNDKGETCSAFTLWVSEYANGSEYVDTSLDDYE